jgi:hypothetical protein
LRLLVPAYFYPTERGLKEWHKLFAASAHAPVVIIVNPASGPGEKADPNYVKVLSEGKGSKATLIGYVATSYAKRPLRDVKADVDRWIRLYPTIQGIFFDEQASGADAVAYQAALYDYVRKEKDLRLVITNPGTVCDERFFSAQALDAACVFEGAWTPGIPRWPGWVAKYGPAHIAALAYKVGTAAQMRACVADAVRQKVGYVYVTDMDGEERWNRLPRYWEEEVAAVSQANRAKGD